MSSLLRVNNDQANTFAEKAFKMQFELNKEIANSYTVQQRRLMYEDILYNLSYLEVASKFDDDRIFTEYTKWLFQLLCNLSNDKSNNRIQTHHRLKQHYQILMEIFSDIESKDDSLKRMRIIKKGIETLDRAFNEENNEVRENLDEYSEIRKRYLGYLIESDTRAAVGLVQNLSKSNIAIEDIFQNILQEVMIEVGDLWHQNKISVDKEHYCTSTTQTALSQFYPIIFDRPRNGCKMITCCVGSELHEMGIRMLSDLFEYYGWDSIYLGAAVPKEAILKSIEENSPDLIGLSVTMPQHLELCLEIVNGIKEKFPKLKIAVGGRAFDFTDELWKKWNVDIYKNNASELVNWANENIVNKMIKQ